MQTQQMAVDLQMVNKQNSDGRRSLSILSSRKNNDSQVRLASEGNMPDHTQDHAMVGELNKAVSVNNTMVVDEYGVGMGGRLHSQASFKSNSVTQSP